MRKTITFFLISFSVLTSGISQRCLADGIILTSQAQVDSFRINFPDCRVIEGDLTIRSGNIDSLTALSRIDSVLGNLITRGFTRAAYEDLENLKYVGKGFKIENFLSDTIGGFQKLEAVERDFLIEQAFHLKSLTGLNRLHKIGGHFKIQYCQNLENFIGLDSLSTVGKDLEAIPIGMLHSFEGLENLDTVGGRLNIQSRNITSYQGLKSLRYVGFNFVIGNQEDLTDLSGLENLREVPGGIWIQVNKELTNIDALSGLINAPIIGVVNNAKLQSVDFRNVTNLRELRVSFCPAITELDNIPDIDDDEVWFYLQGLRNFEGKIPGNLRRGRFIFISNNDKLENLHGLENLESANNLSVSGNENLTDLSVLTNLKSVSSYLSIVGNEQLTSLKGLENLKQIGKLSIVRNDILPSLEDLGNIRLDQDHLHLGLNISENPLLENLDGLQFITKVSGEIEIFENEGLQSLNGLDNLKETEFDSTGFLLSDNPALENMEALDAFKFSKLKELTVTNNPKLEVCDYMEICNFLGSPTRPRTVSGNGLGCQSEKEILDSCALNFAQVYYQVFFDKNENGIRENDEPILPQFKIDIEPGDISAFSGRDRPGVSFLPTGNYIFRVDLKFPWANSTPGSELVTINQITDTVSFGVYPTEIYSGLNTALVSFPIRCNDTVTFFNGLTNLGTTSADGTLWMEIDPETEGLSFVDLPDQNIGDTLVGWNFREFVPGEILFRKIKIKIPGPLDFPIGDSLSFRSYADFSDRNGPQTTDVFYYKRPVECSYDPNDKLVSPNRAIPVFEPPRELNYTLFEEPLTYTVRFQNTGNAPAIDVVIRDTLDENLAVETFNFLGSSHYESLNIRIENNRFLTFDFKDIYLPDSTTNFDASQGFVTYQIQTKEGLSENTAVQNSASIYFDLNPPIKTNTTENIMVSNLPTSSTQNTDNQLDIQIFPNPTNGIFYINGEKLHNAKITISDISGRVLKIEKLNLNAGFSLPQKEKRIYIVKVESEEGTVIKRLVKF